MGKETWYRGVSGRPTAEPGGYSHPLGDGTYFTDKETVAWEYATTKWDSRTKQSDSKAIDRSKQKVFELRVERKSLGRILDLTIDSRWQKFIHQKIGKGAQTVEDLIKHNTELHERSFSSFLKANNLDRESFDAIIGNDYESGGKFHCVVPKKGNQRMLSRRLVAIMKPVRFRTAREDAVGKLIVFRVPATVGKGVIPFRVSNLAAKNVSRVSGTSGTGRGIGIAAIGIGLVVEFLAIVLMPWLMDKYGKPAEKWLKEDLEKLQPSIDLEVQNQSLHAAHLMSEGKDAYANITMTLEMRHVDFGRETHGPHLNPKKVDVNISVSNTNEQKNISASMGVASTLLGTWVTHDLVTSSAKIELPKPAVSFYQAVLDELTWYQALIAETKGNAAAYGMKFMSDDDISQLLEDREQLINSLGDFFNVNKTKTQEHLKSLLLNI